MVMGEDGRGRCSHNIAPLCILLWGDILHAVQDRGESKGDAFRRTDGAVEWDP